ncbi:integrase [Mycobacterium sp. E3298]|uniref:tyrosine-type recombinase/integrase n=1 Tax=Mycobacterium sp. E3298 TaxID=1856865 RepID=UPI0007FC2242|nr:tyrosine-type recombinase/integrase [Mycobacterium sp. E3298]OBG69247.1 integrase [Mycobacterium sp. E3298]
MASIKKRADGVWRARYRDETGKEHARHFGRRVDAQRWIDEVTSSVVTGSYVDPKAGAMTLADFYKEWAARQVWAPGTVKAMNLAINSAPFGDLPMRSIKRSHIETWIKTMAAAELAPGTIRTRLNNVRAVFRGAQRDRVVGSDPCEAVTLPRTRRPEVAMRIPAPETVGKIMGAAEPWFAALVGLCAFAGLRLGEAAGVQLDDIDWLRKTLTVSRQVQRAGRGNVEIRPPKYGSERVVYLPDELIVMLSEHIHAMGVLPGGWLFVGAGGNPPHQDTVRGEWLRALAGAKVSGVKLHDLRHFYASGLIAAGCDVVTVQRALGHRSATTTLSTYSHLWPTAEDRTRRAAAAVMRTALADSCGLSADSGRRQGRAKPL